MAEPNPALPGAAPGTAQLSIERIYVKDLSLENPASPQSFQMTEAPQIEVGLRTRSESIQPDVYECVLTLTVTAKSADKTVFLVEAAQAGIFSIRGATEEQIGMILATHCPSLLFPYAREMVSDATMRMGFPPVHLAPINFEMLYAQQGAQGQAPVGVAN
jgi:preprotein translocase subunit SecB